MQQVRQTAPADCGAHGGTGYLPASGETGLGDRAGEKLTPEHIAAIQATGISDAEKARRVQNSTDKNAESVRRLALEAKTILGGYFREFTFAKRRSCGWTDCGCGVPFMPGVVLDPFMGTGTTLDVAKAMGRSAIGVDLDLAQVEEIL